MKEEKIEELLMENATFSYCGAEMMDLEDFAQAINKAELEWYKELLDKLEFIYGSDLKVFGTIIDKNANNYYKEIQNKIKELGNEN